MTLNERLRGLLEEFVLRAVGAMSVLAPASRARTQGDRELPFHMQSQQASQWCWAATGASVGNYFHGDDNYFQCGVANECLGSDSCCEDAETCNLPWFLDQALQAADSYESQSAGRASYSDVSERLELGRPVGARIEWTGGGGHFVVITGYDSQVSSLTIRDSWYGTSIMQYGAFPESYQIGGTWTHTYQTVPN